MRKLSRPRSLPGNAFGTAIISDPLEVRRLLSRSAEARTEATLKLRGSLSVFRTELIDVDPRQEGLHLRLREDTAYLNRKNLEDAIRSSGSRECMILIYLQGRSIVGVNSEPSEIRDDRLVFSCPTRIFKIQRRKDIRLEIPGAYEFTVEFAAPEQPSRRDGKKVFDLSESGLSFLVSSPSEAALYPEGLIISKGLLRLQNQKIRVLMRVCSHTPYRPSRENGVKIGVEFTEISADDRNYIAQFVYSHAQHLLY